MDEADRVKWMCWGKARLPLTVVKYNDGGILYDVNPSILEEARAIFREVQESFDKYPDSVRWRAGRDENLLRGVLGEAVLDAILDELMIPHIWHRPIIQKERISKRKRSLPDFTVNGHSIDVKISSKEDPPIFLVNLKRWSRRPAEIIVFGWISEDLKTARFYGWIAGATLEECRVIEAPHSPALLVPRRMLRKMRSLFEEVAKPREQKNDS